MSFKTSERENSKIHEFLLNLLNNPSMFFKIRRTLNLRLFHKAMNVVDASLTNILSNCMSINIRLRIHAVLGHIFDLQGKVRRRYRDHP